jgi:DNA-binding NtrC family response regulator
VAKAVPGTTGTILVVEDDENVRDFLEALLSGAGHRVRAASVPIQALELIRSGQFRPDLIISDVVMPEMRGDELAARLKAIDGDLRVLFITGYANVELPAHEILYKPFQAREMLDRVGRLLSPAELADRPR